MKKNKLTLKDFCSSSSSDYYTQAEIRLRQAKDSGLRDEPSRSVCFFSTIDPSNKTTKKAKQTDSQTDANDPNMNTSIK
jgi:hypothetical protein